jgi:hypothetical protein
LNGEPIPDADHVLRHVKGRFIQNDQISGASFRLRENENELSFNWMEFDFYRSHSAEEQVALIRANFPLNLSPKDRFASLNVGAAKLRVLNEHPAAKVLDFIENGYVENPSHCFMTIEELDDMVGDLLAQCILNQFPAVIRESS